MANSYFYHMQSYDGGFGMVPGSESHVSQVEELFVLLQLSI